MNHRVGSIGSLLVWLLGIAATVGVLFLLRFVPLYYEKIEIEQNIRGLVSDFFNHHQDQGRLRDRIAELLEKQYRIPIDRNNIFVEIKGEAVYVDLSYEVLMEYGPVQFPMQFQPAVVEKRVVGRF